MLQQNLKYAKCSTFCKLFEYIKIFCVFVSFHEAHDKIYTTLRNSLTFVSIKTFAKEK